MVPELLEPKLCWDLELIVHMSRWLDVSSLKVTHLQHPTLLF